jgi:hypothetical protein
MMVIVMEEEEEEDVSNFCTYFGLHGKLPIPVTTPYKFYISDTVDLPERRANDNIIPEFKIKLNVIEVMQ